MRTIDHLLDTVDETVSQMHHAPSASTSYKTERVGGETWGPRGLIMRDPYASQILDGEKVWEIRGRPPK